ncbi:MAG TPA: hypothetical protein VG937_05715 [Polyangiaceae bacterium]|jgi:hypothetical protein|nr:hypothetical protein [Polyangiaceae bacterium]
MPRITLPSPFGSRRLFGACLVFACASLVPAHARAEEPSCAAGDRECGREAFAQGTARFDQKDYVGARAFFLAAQAASAHPVIAFNLGLCSARLGQPSRARSELSPLVNDVSLDSALRERAGRELAAAEASLAHIYIDAAAARANRVELDGQQVDATEGELAVDPGAHHVRVSSGETLVFDQDLQLAPGEQLRLRVTNQARAIDVVVVPQASRPAPAAASAPEPRPGLSPAWFYASTSATVLLSAATIWSGLDVNRAYDDYRSDLPRLTQAQADARVDDGHSRELRTNLLLGATVLSAAGTAVLGLVLVDWKPAPGRGAASITLGPAHARLNLAF